jgi:hypothetical protein
MKSLEDIKSVIDKWWRNGMVGNLICYRAPGANDGECIIERVVKAREMRPEVRVAFEMLMDEYGVERGEVFRGSDGKPDRLKFTRRFDG